MYSIRSESGREKKGGKKKGSNINVDVLAAQKEYEKDISPFYFL
jgi:hypothetical protein